MGSDRVIFVCLNVCLGIKTQQVNIMSTCLIAVFGILETIQNCGLHIYGYPQCLIASYLRFGEAVASCRTMCLKKHRRDAKKFLRAARKTKNHMNLRPKANRAWVVGANLQEVFDFLTDR